MYLERVCQDGAVWSDTVGTHHDDKYHKENEESHVKEEDARTMMMEWNEINQICFVH